MAKKLFLASLIIVGGLFYAGCSRGVQPIYEARDVQIINYDGKSLPYNQVEKAILQAGAQYGWTMKKIKEGTILATLYVKKHMATVEIRYSATSYSIVYNNSVNLNYSGVNIHRTYNTWIRKLEDSIRLNLNIL
jgi:hypothetical protein